MLNSSRQLTKLQEQNAVLSTQLTALAEQVSTLAEQLRRTAEQVSANAADLNRINAEAARRIDVDDTYRRTIDQTRADIVRLEKQAAVDMQELRLSHAALAEVILPLRRPSK